jgi:uncharacterized protein (TIGR00255 family)
VALPLFLAAPRLLGVVYWKSFAITSFRPFRPCPYSQLLFFHRAPILCAMLRSMTAYGRASVQNSSGHYTIEIRSINGKFLDIALLLSSELLFFEGDIKKWIASHAERGSLTLKASARFSSQAPVDVYPNLPLVRQLKQAYHALAQEFGIPAESLIPALISKERDLIVYEPNQEGIGQVQQELKQAVSQALANLNAMKETEGAELERDILKRIDYLKASIDAIDSSSTDSVDKLQQKLKAKIEEVVPNSIDNDDRLLREVALYAEKADITEEIIRFRSHLQQFLSALNSQETSKGKLLEFITQEMGREINTIGSKLPSLTRHVVEVKKELDKIREQLQNVE